MTEVACSALDDLGAWDREAALAQDTLRRLPEDSDRRPAWIHQLGILAQDRGNYPEAEARYRQSLEINERLGNLADMTTSTSQMSLLSSVRREAGRCRVLARQGIGHLAPGRGATGQGRLGRVEPPARGARPSSSSPLLAMSSMTPTGRA